MRELLSKPPVAHAEPVTEVLHDVLVVDPYRWLEDQDSPATREWLEQQTVFAREYLDGIEGREQIAGRIREFLHITTYDSVLIGKNCYVFRKRLADHEQPSIYVRDGSDQEGRLLVAPSRCGASVYTAVKPLALSPDSKVLAYEVKEGGERTSRVEFVDIETGHRLPEVLPHGYLRGFSFTPDSMGFFYSVESAEHSQSSDRLLYQHHFGDNLGNDEIVFNAGDAEGARIGVIAGPEFQFILVQRCVNRTLTDYYIRSYGPGAEARKVLADVDYQLSLQFVDGRVLALTNLGAPNSRVVELQFNPDGSQKLVELVPSRQSLIQQWFVLAGHIVVNYLEGTSFRVCIFDLSGKPVSDIPLPDRVTVRLVAASAQNNELLLECESFFDSASIHKYSFARNELTTWADSVISLDPETYGQRQIWYVSRDGTRIPMFLVGLHTNLARQNNPVILTSYGGFQVPMTPQFSVLVACLMEMGCVFALPNIRGGSEFGAEWHLAAQRHRRQTAFDDFLAAAEWLVESGVGDRNKIAIFGGSNSGLLVGAALTQRPDLFSAVLCMAPLLDMIRYHQFDGARKWIDEYGTAEDPNDFGVLWSYSPYHRISNNTPYPAVMMISGDADQKCNPLHARKMVARLQAASSSPHPIILDYSKFRGHTPVLPLSIRVAALTDRIAFLCDQLQLERRGRS